MARIITSLFGGCCDDPCGITQPCAYPIYIIYDWGGTGQRDLDTNTVFLGEENGYACGDGGIYTSWTGDDTSENGREHTRVDVFQALNDGAWSGSTTIEAYAGWYEPADGSGPAELFVACSPDITRPFSSRTISPGSQDDCAATLVMTITVFEDGTAIFT